jgi:hypothetical protein
LCQTRRGGITHSQANPTSISPRINHFAQSESSYAYLAVIIKGACQPATSYFRWSLTTRGHREEIDANRREARRNTGSKSAEGTAAVRLNALQHGLASKNAGIFSEHEEAFCETRNAILGHPQAARRRPDAPHPR